MSLFLENSAGTLADDLQTLLDIFCFIFCVYN